MLLKTTCAKSTGVGSNNCEGFFSPFKHAQKRFYYFGFQVCNSQDFVKKLLLLTNYVIIYTMNYFFSTQDEPEFLFLRVQFKLEVVTKDVYVFVSMYLTYPVH